MEEIKVEFDEKGEYQEIDYEDIVEEYLQDLYDSDYLLEIYGNFYLVNVK